MRTPRPMGLTQLSLIYQRSKTPANKDTLIKHLVISYITNGYTIQNKSISIQDFSSIYNIPSKYILNIISNQSKNLIRLSSPKQMTKAFEAAMGMTLTLSMRDTGLTMNQIEILNKAQGGIYKPFISSEVNRAIANVMKSTENMAKVAMMLNPGNYVKKMIDTDNKNGKGVGDQPGQGGKVLTLSDAIQLLENEPIDYSELQAKYLTDDLPNVDARIVGKGDNINLKKTKVLPLSLKASEPEIPNLDPSYPLIE